MKDFFQDCPWLQIPPHRNALIIENVTYPRPRLLGGAPKDGKVSRIAALAAKRRQQEAAKSSSSEADRPKSSDDYTDTLNKLRISQANRASPHTSQTATVHDLEQEAPLDASKTASHGEVQPKAKSDEPSEPQMAQSLRAKPSAFASLLIGSKSSNNAGNTLSPSELGSMGDAFDFTEPSPDDVVDRARNSKGRP